MHSFRAVIELWPSREAMAAELGARPQAVSKWWQRNSIPSAWWVLIVASPVARAAGVTGDVLLSLKGGPRSPAKCRTLAEATR